VEEKQVTLVKRESWPTCRYYLGIDLDRLRKTRKGIKKILSVQRITSHLME
jgi:hypothetical protein